MCKSLWTWHSSSVYFRLLYWFCGGCLLNQSLLNTLKTWLWTWALWALFIDKLKGVHHWIQRQWQIGQKRCRRASFYHEIETFLVELVFLKTKVMITLETRVSWPDSPDTAQGTSPGHCSLPPLTCWPRMIACSAVRNILCLDRSLRCSCQFTTN